MKLVVYSVFYFVVLLSVALFVSGCSQIINYKSTKYTSAARYKATMRPYKVRGKRYRPRYVNIGDTMRGIASWYGPDFHGKQTSNGQRYNMHAMTAAHKTWPMDTIVRVDNLKNGKSVTVRINDRGPFVNRRIIDCSYAAAKALGLDKTGIAPVRLTVIGFVGKNNFKHKKSKKSKKQKIFISKFAVQIGAFNKYKSALHFIETYYITDNSRKMIVKRSSVGSNIIYKVWITGFATSESAKDFIKKYNITSSFVVRQ